MTCPKIFSTGIPWKTRKDISSLTFWLSLLQATALSMRTWCVQKQTFTRFSNFCKVSLFLLHVFCDNLGGAIYSGSPSDRSPLLLRFPDCNGKHPLWNVQSVDRYLHQRSQREVSYWTWCGSYLGAMMSGAGVRTSADNGSWVLDCSRSVDMWSIGCRVSARKYRLYWAPYITFLSNFNLFWHLTKWSVSFAPVENICSMLLRRCHV